MNETRRAVLCALDDGPVTGPALAERLGVSRTAVWKHVEALRDAGFTVESVTDGYTLAGVPEYGAEAVEFGLDAPFDVEHHGDLPSTNDRARELAVRMTTESSSAVARETQSDSRDDERAPPSGTTSCRTESPSDNGQAIEDCLRHQNAERSEDADGARDVVVLADRQTGGRGRRGREWSSPPGGVWMSLVLRPDVPPARAPLLTLAAAVAVTDAAREAGVDAAIKWPNDVVVPREDDESGRGGAKLAGVLTEMEGEASRVSWVVLGVGVNVNVDPADLEGDATSVRAEAGDVSRRVFVQRVLERFDALRDDPDATLAAWRERAATVGQRVRVETGNGDVVGDAVGVTEHGALVVETAEGEQVVHAGDCQHLRSA